MSNFLNSETFGSNIYNRFPPIYRDEDAQVNFALKRYLEALSEGGFKIAIEEINGIAHLIDPGKTQKEVLPILFEQYGLEVFNGIPENFLRYLLPRLGEAWSKKGSISVIEFITSSLTGIKTTTSLEYDKENNLEILVKLNMDDALIDSYFPDSNTDKFKILLSNFVPFYCDLRVVYSSLFIDTSELGGIEKDLFIITDNKTEESDTKVLEYVYSIIRESIRSETASIKGDYSKTEKLNFKNDKESSSVSGSDTQICAITTTPAVEDISTIPTENEFGRVKTKTEIDPISTTSNTGMNSITNRTGNTLNVSFYTNALHHYDIIHKYGESDQIRY